MTQKQSKEMARLAYQAMEDKKARDIRIIDISKISVLADYFLIASGSKLCMQQKRIASLHLCDLNVVLLTQL